MNFSEFLDYQERGGREPSLKESTLKRVYEAIEILGKDQLQKLNKRTPKEKPQYDPLVNAGEKRYHRELIESQVKPTDKISRADLKAMFNVDPNDDALFSHWKEGRKDIRKHKFITGDYNGQEQEYFLRNARRRQDDRTTNPLSYLESRGQVFKQAADRKRALIDSIRETGKISDPQQFLNMITAPRMDDESVKRMLPKIYSLFEDGLDEYTAQDVFDRIGNLAPEIDEDTLNKYYDSPSVFSSGMIDRVSKLLDSYENGSTYNDPNNYQYKVHKTISDRVNEVDPELFSRFPNLLSATETLGVKDPGAIFDAYGDLSPTTVDLMANLLSGSINDFESPDSEGIEQAMSLMFHPEYEKAHPWDNDVVSGLNTDWTASTDFENLYNGKMFDMGTEEYEEVEDQEGKEVGWSTILEPEDTEFFYPALEDESNVKSYPRMLALAQEYSNKSGQPLMDMLDNDTKGFSDYLRKVTPLDAKAMWNKVLLPQQEDGQFVHNFPAPGGRDGNVRERIYRKAGFGGQYYHPAQVAQVESTPNGNVLRPKNLISAGTEENVMRDIIGNAADRDEEFGDAIEEFINNDRDLDAFIPWLTENIDPKYFHRVGVANNYKDKQESGLVPNPEGYEGMQDVILNVIKDINNADRSK